MDKVAGRVSAWILESFLEFLQLLQRDGGLERGGPRGRREGRALEAWRVGRGRRRPAGGKAASEPSLLAGLPAAAPMDVVLSAPVAGWAQWKGKSPNLLAPPAGGPLKMFLLA